MIQGLLDDKSLALFASCSIDTNAPHRRSAASYSQASCSLDITVYGPIELFDEIGEWLQEYNVYLQDPRNCDLDVRYWNPQRLSSSDPRSCPYVSQVVLLGSGLVQFEEIDEQPDLLDIISGQDDLEEATAPKVIRAALHKSDIQSLHGDPANMLTQAPKASTHFHATSGERMGIRDQKSRYLGGIGLES